MALFQCPDGRNLLSQADCADPSLPTLYLCSDGMPVTDMSLCRSGLRRYLLPAALVVGAFLLFKK